MKTATSLITSMLAKLGIETKNKLVQHPAYTKIKAGKFLYDSQYPKNYIVRSKDIQWDFLDHIGIELTSKIEWLSDLEYKLTLMKINDDEQIHLKVGDTLHATIIDITHDFYVIESNYKETIKQTEVWFVE